MPKDAGGRRSVTSSVDIREQHDVKRRQGPSISNTLPNPRGDGYMGAPFTDRAQEAYEESEGNNRYDHGDENRC